MGVSVTGAVELRKLLTEGGNNLLESLIPEIDQIGDEIVANAQGRAPLYVGKYRPGIIRGLLRASGGHTEAKRNGDSISMEIYFGGEGSGAESYALEQHENLSFNHEVGEAKYLENAVIDKMDGIEERLGSVVSFTR